MAPPVVLICISLMANDTEHLSSRVLVCHLSILFGEMSMSFAHFLIGLFRFYC